MAVPTVRGENSRSGESRETPFDLGAAPMARSRSRIPEILLGTLLVALFALAGAWFYSTSTNRVGYLALRAGVQRGEVIEQADLAVYQIDTDAPIQALRPTQTADVVGKVALVDLTAGTLLTGSHLADRSQIPAGSGIVGLDLDLGQFPSLSLRPGDRVQVVAVDTSGSTDADAAVEIIADQVEIVSVAESGGSGRFYSLVLETELAQRVLAADARDEVRLIEVPEG